MPFQVLNAMFLSGDASGEIAQGRVQVRDDVDRSVVTIVGDLFEPGSATVAAPYRPLLRRIGEELERVPGLIRVTGHTDSQPIRTVRFPSNWLLSQERARIVGESLSQKLTNPRRISIEGLSDTEPVAPNNTAEGRARNRRVEVTLLLAPATAVQPVAEAPPQK